MQKLILDITLVIRSSGAHEETTAMEKQRPTIVGHTLNIFVFIFKFQNTECNKSGRSIIIRYSVAVMCLCTFAHQMSGDPSLIWEGKDSNW